MHRPGSVASVVTLTLLVGAMSALVVRVVRSQEKRTSFTATKIERYYRQNGELARTEEFTEGVRSDGSTVTIRRTSGPGGVAVEEKVITDLPTRRQISVEPLTESISTTEISDRKAQQLSQKPSSCTSEAPGVIGPRTGQRSTMLGYEVVSVEGDLPGPPGGGRHVEEWRAPALDCYALKYTFSVGAPGGEMVATNIREVASIVPGEPPRSLFQVPAGYTERAPSQILEELQRRYPSITQHVCPTCPRTLEWDKKYYRQKPANK